MKLGWSPRIASEVLIDTVQTLRVIKHSEESAEAELVSAMAGGWNSKLIVEARACGGAGAVATSIGLTVAARHTCGRHVCMVPDERSRSEYTEAMLAAGVSPPEVVAVGEGEAAAEAGRLVGVDFMVVDGRRRDSAGLLRSANLSHGGAVLVCNNSSNGGAGIMDGFKRGNELDLSTRGVRSVFLPVGKGLDVSYVGRSRVSTPPARNPSRWIRFVDRVSGEEHLIRG